MNNHTYTHHILCQTERHTFAEASQAPETKDLPSGASERNITSPV